MKHVLIILTLILSCVNLSKADEPDTLLYHVIAESGLVLRAGEGVETEKLLLIPYEDTLRVVGMYLLTYPDKRVKIGGVEGYWLPAIYQGVEGFIFTAYIKRGKKYIEDTGELLYRLVFEERVQSPLNYAPGLYWYGFYQDSTGKGIQMKEIELSMDVVEENFGEYDAFTPLHYKVNTNKSKKAKFIIGMKKPMESTDKSGVSYSREFLEGKFLHAYEVLELHGKSTMYVKPIAKITKDTSDTGVISEMLDYHLTLSNMAYSMYYDHAIDFPFPDVLDHSGSVEKHTVYKNPQIYWKGDLNEDGNDDLIIKTTHMSDSCGGGVGFHILISKPEGEYFRLEKQGSGGFMYEGC